MSWLPIKTAPTDGTIIDLYRQQWVTDFSGCLSKKPESRIVGERIPACAFNKGHKEFVSSITKEILSDKYWTLTHWMPVPNPPTE